ncbi:MAG: TlpA disulfide reductase family protein [Acidobacteriota bacterium]
MDRSRRPSADGFPVEDLGAGPSLELLTEAADGRPGTLSALRGRPVLVHFWATWCPPCRDEMPALLALSRALKTESGVELLAVSLDDRWASIELFFDGTLPPEVVKVVAEGQRAFAVGKLPVTFVIRPDGSPAARIEGARDWSSRSAHDTMRRVLAGIHGSSSLAP